MPNQIPLVNGEAFSFSQISIELLGYEPVGITAISYKKTQEKENIYGLGEKPVARGRGTKVLEGSITMLANEIIKLQEFAPAGGDIMDIPPFNIQVSYTRGDVIVTDVLRKCEFTEDPRESSQGDMSIEVEVPLVIGDIEFGR